jgi:small subunit ribosomal protein S16
MIKIRLMRGGRPNHPYYTLVATNSRSKRDGDFLEKLGRYNPSEKDPLTNINVEAINSWLKKGALLSETVRTLLKNNKITVASK